MFKFMLPFVGFLLACAAPAADARTGTARETRLDEWTATHPHARTLTVSGKGHAKYYRAYACETYDGAVAVVSAIRAAGERMTSPLMLQAVMRRGLRDAKCSPAAAGQYTPHEVGDFAIIDLGYEADEEWTPIRAFGANGRIANLVYDASVYAIAD